MTEWGQSGGGAIRAKRLFAVRQRGCSPSGKEAVRRPAKRLFVVRQRGCSPSGKEAVRTAASNLDAEARLASTPPGV
ncbi:MAG: hypothetical protein LBF85_06370 [Tannerella sp.]|jgi:hypothetical protein|nr:hypothetical protein [Tannerella sp.]